MYIIDDKQDRGISATLMIVPERLLEKFGSAFCMFHPLNFQHTNEQEEEKHKIHNNISRENY